MMYRPRPKEKQWAASSPKGGSTYESLWPIQVCRWGNSNSELAKYQWLYKQKKKQRMQQEVISSLFDPFLFQWYGIIRWVSGHFALNIILKFGFHWSWKAAFMLIWKLNVHLVWFEKWRHCISQMQKNKLEKLLSYIEPGGELPYISHIGMCCNKGYGFCGFCLKTDIDFAHFGNRVRIGEPGGTPPPRIPRSIPRI